VIGFITEHKDNQVPGPDGGAGLRWGVEPMCEALTKAGIKISPSTYYEWISKQPTKRQLADSQLVDLITAQRDDKKTGKFVQTLGSRKLWIRLRGQGHDVARCTVETIMREQGWEGARYGSKHKTTAQDQTHDRYPDRVDRNFHVPAPNRLWVADFTYSAQPAVMCSSVGRATLGVAIASCATAHNHRSCRKARSRSPGLNRVGAGLGSSRCCRTASLAARSASRY
jgi:putative transposase